MLEENVTWKQNVLNRVNSGDVQLIWEKVKVNNLPKEDPILRNFNNSRKAIRVSWKRKGKTYSNYYTPESILGLMGVSQEIIQAARAKGFSNKLLLTLQEQPMYAPMFRNPVTRNVVFRRNIKFVIMEKRTNKNIAATKIQAAFRGGRERQKTLNNAKRMTALITSKKQVVRSPNKQNLNKARRNANNRARNEAVRRSRNEAAEARAKLKAKKAQAAKNANNRARRAAVERSKAEAAAERVAKLKR